MNKLFILVITLFSLNSCCPEDAFIPSYNIVSKEDKAFVRFIHSSENSGEVNVIFKKDFFDAKQKFLSFENCNNEAKYYPIDTSNSSVKIVDINNKLLVQYVSLNFLKDHYYTIFFYSNEKLYNLLVSEDKPTVTLESSKTLLRFVNLSSDLPPIEIREDSDTGRVFVSNLKYGESSEFISTKAYPPFSSTGTGLFLFNSESKEYLYGILKPYIYTFGGSIATIIISGKKDAFDTDSMLTFSIFQDNTFTNDLFGSIPYNLKFFGIRYVNFINDFSTNDFRTALAFYDTDRPSNLSENEYYRRAYPGFFLGNFPPHAHFVNETSQWHKYFFYYPGFKTISKFRIEEGTGHDNNSYFLKQKVIVPPQDYKFQTNLRYTIVSYGEFSLDTSLNLGKALVIPDKLPKPSIKSKSTVRFVNLAFGEYKNKKLSLRINGISTPFLSYGEFQTDRFLEVNPSDKYEVIDENKNVLYNKILNLHLGENYTIFFANQPNNKYFELLELSNKVKVNIDRN